MELDDATYAAAESLLTPYRSKLTPGATVRARWIDQGARFWYRVETGHGAEFVLVDPERGTREAAFDHERLAAALSAAAGEPVDAADLPFRAITPVGAAVEFDAFETHWRCRLDTYTCEKSDPPARGPLDVGAGSGWTAPGSPGSATTTSTTRSRCRTTPPTSSTRPPR